jgi:hypothetical protein
MPANGHEANDYCTWKDRQIRVLVGRLVGRTEFPQADIRASRRSCSSAPIADIPKTLAATDLLTPNFGDSNRCVATFHQATLSAGADDGPKTQYMIAKAQMLLFSLLL